MEIKGLDEFLGSTKKEEQRISIGDVLEKAKETGASLDVIAKSLILTYLEFDYKKYCEIKTRYLDEVIKPSEERKTDGLGKEQIKRIKQMHELEIEILKTKLEIVNKKLGV